MEVDFAKLISAKFGDIGATIKQSIAVDSDFNLTDLFKHVLDHLFANIEDRRKADIHTILIDIHTVYYELFCFRANFDAKHSKSYEAHAKPLEIALPRIVNYSFALEYRRLQILFGLVNALADLLVWETRCFGYHVECQYCRKTCACRLVRRSIGNALVNLTYKQRECKLSLCLHSAFLDCVTQIIANVPFLAQCYAGLIRNLSWNTDETVARQALAQTVPALTSASLATTDQKCLLAVLSALWNLAPHSTHNKRVICERREFLALLARLLTDDVRYATLVESVSGVLKYLCSYIKDHDSLQRFLIGNEEIISRLLPLLQSSTFTVIVNALGALCALSSQDNVVQHMLATDDRAMRLICQLRKSKREDVSNAAKALLDNLRSANFPPRWSPNAESNYSGYSQTLDPNFYHCNRHANTLRANSNSGGQPNVSGREAFDCQQPLTYAPFSGTEASSTAATKSNTMPRPSASSNAIKLVERHPSLNEATVQRDLALNAVNNYGVSDASQHYHPGFHVLAPCSSRQTKMDNQELDANVDQPNFDYMGNLETVEGMCPSTNGGDELTESMQCTTSGSMESLNSIQHNDEWPSTITTASNSGTQSPASCVDLPDSPSHCGTLRESHFNGLRMPPAESDQSQANLLNNNYHYRHQQPGSSSDGTKCGGACDSSSYRTSSSQTQNCAFVAKRMITTSPNLKKKESSLPDENDINERLLCDMIETVLPKPMRNLKKPLQNKIPNESDDRFLNECIALVMPHKNSVSNVQPVYESGHNNAVTYSNHVEAAHCQQSVMDASQTGIDWDDSHIVEPLCINDEEREFDYNSGGHCTALFQPQDVNSSVVPFVQSAELSCAAASNNKSSDVRNSQRLPFDYPNGNDSSFYKDLKKSSFLESQQTFEKIRDASQIQQATSTRMALPNNDRMVVSSSSEDNYNFAGVCDVNDVDLMVPEDVDEELRARDELVVDCGKVASSTTTNSSTAGSGIISSVSPSKMKKPLVVPQRTTLQRPHTAKVSDSSMLTSNNALTQPASHVRGVKSVSRKPPVAPKPKLPKPTQTTSRNMLCPQ